jgi:hypothetical protein
MAYILKGFIELSSSLQDSPNDISTFGELSTYSLTFSKNKKVYVDATPSNMELVAFTTKTSTNNLVEVPQYFRDQIYDITTYLLTLQQSNNAITDKQALITHLADQYNTEVISLNLGDLVEDNNNITFPTWIEFRQLNVTASDYTENTIRIWYSDESFKTQYDEYEIFIIPPIANIDSLFGNLQAVTLAVNNYSKALLLNRINVIKNGNPETTIATEDYTWHDFSNITNTLNTTWTAVIYGRVGEDLDAIRLAIRDYIDVNSARPETDWRVVYPDLYLNTEFYFLPRWKNYAIQERQLQVGQHSPIVNLKKELDYVKRTFTSFSDTFVNSNLCAIPSQFRSLMLLAIGSPDNVGDTYTINKIVPDYLNVPTTDPGFDMMSVDTRTFHMNLHNAIVWAEKVTSYDTLPNGLRKVVKNNILFVVFKFKNIDYYISSKITTPDY